jgi:hypothetical protein
MTPAISKKETARFYVRNRRNGLLLRWDFTETLLPFDAFKMTAAEARSHLRLFGKAYETVPVERPFEKLKDGLGFLF